MIKYKILIVSAIFFMLFLVSSASADNVYTSHFYSGNQTTISKMPTLSINIPYNSLVFDMQCIGNISGSGVTTCTGYNPHNNTLFTSTLTTIDDCVSFGDYDNVYDGKLDNIENRVKLTSSAGSYFSRLDTIFNVYSDNNYLIFSQNSTKDYSNMVKNFYGNSEFVMSPTIYFNDWITENLDMIGNATDCYNYNLEPTILQGAGWGCDGGGDSAYRIFKFIRMFPFNSSHEGLINYDIQKQGVDVSVMGGGTASAGYEIGYASLGGSKTVLSTTTTANGTLSLTPNTEYVFYIASYGKGKGTGSGVGSCSISENDYYTKFNISIYTPSYECSDWSDCDSGLKFRLCTDSKGVADDKIETQSCFTLPDNSVTLGFEDSITRNVWKSYPQWWVFACPFFADVFSVSYPNTWTPSSIYNPIVIDNVTGDSGLLFDTLRITSEEQYEGVNSLKMWAINPEQHIPACTNQSLNSVANGTSCWVTGEGNYTIGSVPVIEKPINETFLLSHNLTFDYPNMSISAYVKKCSEPVQQYAGNVTTGSFCGEGYYTSDKTNNWDIENTKVWLVLHEEGSYSWLQWIFNANSEKWSKKEIQLENLSTTANYTLSIGIFPDSDSIVSSKVSCAYVDNIEINGYQGTFPCESRCEGDVRYEAREVEPNGCVYDIINPSPICTNENNIYFIENCISYCNCDSTSSNYLTYYLADNSSYECLWDNKANSSYCLDYCDSSEPEGVSMTEPLPVLNTLFDSSGVEWAGKFFSPLMLIFYILIIVMGLMSYYTEAWQIGLVTGMIFMIAIGTLYPVQFGWITIIFIIISAMVLAKSIYPSS